MPKLYKFLLEKMQAKNIYKIEFYCKAGSVQPAEQSAVEPLEEKWKELNKLTQINLFNRRLL